MNLWTLERHRLVRTNRILLLLGAYLFFGATGPLTARYLSRIIGRFGGDVTIAVPDPTPADGITQFVSNAGQLGVLAVVIVAAAALAFDADREQAIFLRTRVRDTWQLLLPRVVTVTAAAVLALVVGTALAVALTVALLGPLDAGAVLLGTALGALYLGFVVTLTAAVATTTKSVLGTVLATVALLLALPLLTLLPGVDAWVPSELLGAVDALVRGVPASEVLPAAVTTVLAIAGLLVLARWRLDRREL